MLIKNIENNVISAIFCQEILSCHPWCIVEPFAKSRHFIPFGFSLASTTNGHDKSGSALMPEKKNPNTNFNLQTPKNMLPKNKIHEKLITIPITIPIP